MTEYFVVNDLPKFTGVGLHLVNECAGTKGVNVIAGTKGTGDITSLEAFNLSEIKLDIVTPSIQFVLNCSSEKLGFDISSNDTGSYTSGDADWAGNEARHFGD